MHPGRTTISSQPASLGTARLGIPPLPPLPPLSTHREPPARTPCQGEKTLALHAHCVYSDLSKSSRWRCGPIRGPRDTSQGGKEVVHRWEVREDPALAGGPATLLRASRRWIPARCMVRSVHGGAGDSGTHGCQQVFAGLRTSVLSPVLLHTGVGWVRKTCRIETRA
jgi:hypothetical protein